MLVDRSLSSEVMDLFKFPCMPKSDWKNVVTFLLLFFLQCPLCFCSLYEHKNVNVIIGLTRMHTYLGSTAREKKKKKTL